jgi:uncharacterized membrane protein YphA (DoxX/SURF4 family)
LQRIRSFPLGKHRFQIGLLAVVALVVLRLALGCHFLYEGLWKITHRDEFSAAPFLSQAKGPLANLFYAMTPDLYGQERLKVVAGPDGKKTIDSTAITDRWDRIRREFLDFYRPASPTDAASNSDQAAAYRKLEQAADQAYHQFRDHLDEYFRENAADIAAYFDSLNRFLSDKERGQGAPYQNQRRWQRMMDLRAEAAQWIKEVEEQEKAFVGSLYGLLEYPEKPGEVERTGRYHGKPVPMPATGNPLGGERIEQINFAVTYGLTAIGLCLVLGFCTRLAALGGAAFMAFVVMTQPAFPTIYPPDPAVVGHALLVNKDFIELVALLVIAAVGAGRWGGLDFFCRCCCCCRGSEKGGPRHSERSEESCVHSAPGKILRSAQNDDRSARNDGPQVPKSLNP